MTDSSVLPQELLEQAAAYQVGATLFAEGPAQDLLAELAAQKPNLTGPLAAMAARVAETEDFAALKTDLNAEYARLFYNMSATPISLFESVYNSDEKVLMREPYDHMKELLKAEGVTIKGMEKVPEDHIAHELFLMAVFKERAASALEAQDSDTYGAYLTKQKDFYDEHLSTWIPQVMHTVQQLAQDEFYVQAAQFVQDVLEGDAAFLQA